MDADRFDALSILLGDAGASRRSILGRLGGLAALLTGIGLLAADEEAEAKRRHRRHRRKRHKHKNKHRHRRRNKRGGGGAPQTSFPILVPGLSQQCTPGAVGACPVGSTCVAVAPGSTTGVCLSTGVGGVPCTTTPQAGCPANFICANVGGLNACVPASVGGTCDSGADCTTGFCDASGQCALCPTVCGAPGAPVCCVVGTQCVGGATCVVSP